MTTKEKPQLQLVNIEDGLFKLLMNRRGLALLGAIIRDEPGTWEARRMVSQKLDAEINEANIRPNYWKEFV